MTARRIGGAIATLGFLATILLANWLTTRYGFVPVGFGLMATAGTFAAGFALALRDAVQDSLGRLAVTAAIVVGAGLSFLVADPFIALASAAAFLVSELADFAVYTPLRGRARIGGRKWAVAVLASNAVGAVVDTAIFLGIAFGAVAILPGMPGQFVGKAWATLLFLALGWVVGHAFLREPLDSKGA
jgi:queuosine precursor transporter